MVSVDLQGLNVLKFCAFALMQFEVGEGIVAKLVTTQLFAIVVQTVLYLVVLYFEDRQLSVPDFHEVAVSLSDRCECDVLGEWRMFVLHYDLIKVVAVFCE